MEAIILFLFQLIELKILPDSAEVEVVVVVVDLISGITGFNGLCVFNGLLEPVQLNFSIISDGF